MSTKQPAGPKDPRTDPDVPAGMSIELLKDLHLLTRDGQLNADARRKLKQIRHLVNLLKPALDDALARGNPNAKVDAAKLDAAKLDAAKLESGKVDGAKVDGAKVDAAKVDAAKVDAAKDGPLVVDCGAGKSYLGALLYELVLAPAGRGTLLAIEARPELSEQAAARAARFGQTRFRVATGSIAAADLPGRPQIVTALHACDTATDDALALAITANADHVAVVPCCQAEVARQLEKSTVTDAATAALFEHPLHRRELGSHLTNVVRALVLEAHGYKVTVTELVGWEHSAKNELILGRRVNRFDRNARTRLRELLNRFGIEPALVRTLAARNLDPRSEPTT